MVVIDVTDWMKDEHHAVFPVGARDKDMIWSPKTQLLGIKPEWPYLFKESIFRYPDQYWTELVAYIISKHLAIDVPRVLPAMKVTEDGIVCGSLIEWFYDVEEERFVHAGSYFKRLIPEFDDKTGKEHNFSDMNLIIRFLTMKANLKTDRLLWLADMVMFDSLIGNTDRHQENWGVVFCADNTSHLSPLFDNGTSLGHERFIEHIQGWDDPRIKAYINRGKHHLRLTREDTDNRLGHFELLKGVFDANVQIAQHIQQKVDNLDLDGMLAEIEDLTRIEAEIPFSQERFEWIKKNIEIRFDLIKEELIK
ncbi:HipA domain-containing protein [Aliivibrio fischeri]|uniref:HipA-like C-terminal domain-containing protein n=1 Tax=Aliivibrio fischeri TaxID=668 RepID=A0A510UKV0_ALIFS|nr:HipA domain-containing protein [Aliivibrio fischeri]GEK15189.1 hypothetical protein AFI02nite_32250 [Aliivibrio fischeri]